MHAHRIERTPAVYRPHIKRSWRWWKFAGSQSNDFCCRRNPPQMPRGIGIIGGSPTATKVDFVVGSAHSHEVSGRRKISPCRRGFPSTDGKPVETQHDERRDCEDAEEDPSGHLGEVRRERPRQECRSLLGCLRVGRRSVREQAGWSSRLHVREQPKGECPLCRDPNRGEAKQLRASFRR